MHTLYVYYKVAPDQAGPLLGAMLTLQGDLRQAMPGLSCELQRRSDTAEAGHQTWMETYRFNGFADNRAWDRLDHLLDTALSAFPPTSMGPRHSERFVRLSASDSEGV